MKNKKPVQMGFYKIAQTKVALVGHMSGTYMFYLVKTPSDLPPPLPAGRGGTEF